MSLQDFITTYSGQPNVGDTPENTGECVGLVEVWTDSLGLPHTWGNAKDLIADADRNAFDVIYNSPDGVPSPGDIFCFDGYYGGGAGHTGLVVSANQQTVTLFQQNDPEGSRPHLKAYSYDHAIGWLHPKVLNKENEVSTPDINVARILAWGLGGRNGFEGRPNALDGSTDSDLKQHMQIETNQDVIDWYQSQEFQNWGKSLSGTYNKLADLTTQNQSQQKAIGLAGQHIEALDLQINQLRRDYQAAVSAQKAAEDALQAQTGKDTPPVTDTPQNDPTPSTDNSSWVQGLIAWLKRITKL